jgi:uncharacterized caspase-like protein
MSAKFRWMIILSVLFITSGIWAGISLQKSSLLGTAYVISIGVDVSNLKDIPNFNGCANDVNFLAELFINSATRHPDIDTCIVTRFINEAATLTNIESAVLDIAQQIRPEDCFIFHFSGGGIDSYYLPEGFSNLQFFINYSAESQSIGLNNLKDSLDIQTIERIRETFITLERLKSWLDIIPAKNQLVILDAIVTDVSGFFNDLVSLSIESDPLLTTLYSKNRIYVLPDGFSYETECYNGSTGGSLSCALYNASDEFNLFDLFLDDRSYEVATRYWPIQQQNRTRIRFIFESDFFPVIQTISQLQESSRGTGLLNPVNSRPAVEAGAIRNYALLIGTNTYDEPSWKDLRNPVADVQAIAGKLDEYYGFQAEVLLDPTREEILRTLLKYKRDIAYDSLSQLMVFIAGHGLYDDAWMGAIAAKDSRDLESDVLLDTYISHSKLRDILEGIECDHILVVLDVCFGGTFTKRLSSMIIAEGEDDAAADPGIYRQVSNEELIYRKMGQRTRLYMTSGGKEYVPDGRPGYHSPFAAGFIEALESRGGNDGILTYGEIKARVERLVPEPCGGTFGYSNGDFVFVAKEVKK